MPLQSVEACEEQCQLSHGCVAIEYSKGRCELWLKEVQATKNLPGPWGCALEMLLYMLLYNVYKYTITILYLVLCFIYVIYIYYCNCILYILLYNNFIIYIYITIYYILDIMCIYIYIIIYYMLFIIYHTCILYPGPSIGTSNLRPIHIRAQFGATSAHFNVIEFLLFERFFETRAFFASLWAAWVPFPLWSQDLPLVCVSCALIRSWIGLNVKHHEVVR